MHLTSFALITFYVSQALAATYSLSDNYVGSNFLSTFVHENIADPTHGRVYARFYEKCLHFLTFRYFSSNYVDQATAVAKNLTFASGDTLILRADDTTILDPNGPGRNSVRIRSVKTYTTHVAM